MIFSFSKNIVSQIPILPSEKADIFCYFQVETSLDLSHISSEFLISIMSSLRMKRSVLILSESVAPDEKFDFNYGVRAYEGEGFLYLAPHGLSLLRPFSLREVSNFEGLRSLFYESKLLKSQNN